MKQQLLGRIAICICVPTPLTFVLKSSSLIVDTRGRYLEPAPNVVKA